MKKLKIGDINTNVVTGSEINILRWTAFHNWYIQIYENIDNPSINALFSDLQLPINNKNILEIERLIENFKQANLLKSEAKPSAWQICFALICSEDGECLIEISEDFLLEKIKRFAEQGLTFETVKKEVLNFTLPSEATLNHRPMAK